MRILWEDLKQISPDSLVQHAAGETNKHFQVPFLPTCRRFSIEVPEQNESLNT